MKTYRSKGGRRTRIANKARMKAYLKRIGLRATITLDAIDGYQIIFCTGHAEETEHLGRKLVQKFSGQLDLVERYGYLRGQGGGTDMWACVRGLRIHEICSQ